MKLNTLRLAFTGLLLVSSQTAMALPNAFQATYSVAKGHLTLGTLHVTLKYSGNQYHYHKNTRATGLAKLLTGIKISENTSGSFFKENLKPVNYLFNQSQYNKQRIDKILFNGNKVTGSYKGRPYNISITPGTLDRASLEIALASDLSNNKSRLSYTIVEHGEIKNYAFSKLGEEKTKTNAGTFNTIKLSVIRKGNKRQTTFWLAKELDYIPVKIRHKEKGDLITTVIKNYKRL